MRSNQGTIEIEGKSKWTWIHEKTFAPSSNNFFFGGHGFIYVIFQLIFFSVHVKKIFRKRMINTSEIEQFKDPLARLDISAGSRSVTLDSYTVSFRVRVDWFCWFKFLNLLKWTRNCSWIYLSMQYETWSLICSYEVGTICVYITYAKWLMWMSLRGRWQIQVNK